MLLTASQNSRKSFHDVHSASLVAFLLSVDDAIAGQRAKHEMAKAKTPSVCTAISQNLDREDVPEQQDKILVADAEALERDWRIAMGATVAMT